MASWLRCPTNSAEGSLKLLEASPPPPVVVVGGTGVGVAGGFDWAVVVEVFGCGVGGWAGVEAETAGVDGWAGFEEEGAPLGLKFVSASLSEAKHCLPLTPYKL